MLISLHPDAVVIPLTPPHLLRRQPGDMVLSILPLELICKNFAVVWDLELFNRPISPLSSPILRIQ
jgi:hypothetical protein